VLEVDGGGTDEGVAGGLVIVSGGKVGWAGAVAVMPIFCRWMASNTFQLEMVRHKQMDVRRLTDLCGRVVVGFMNCIILARLTFSKAVSSGSIAEAFLFSEGGAVGTETLRILFTARVKCGSGSRHRGGAVDICARLGGRPNAL